MKRFVAILFLSLIFLNYFGAYFYFFARLTHIRHEAREKLKLIPEENLAKLILTPEEYKKSRVDDHEVKVNGKMYDIARIKKEDGMLVIFAEHDEAEDNLLAFLDKVVKRSHHDDEPVPGSIIDFISLSFLVPSFSWQNKLPQDIQHLTTYRKTLLHFIDESDSPPPRF